VGDIIRSGGLNTWLLRPLPPIFNALSSEIAGKVVYSIFTVPVAILLAVLLRPELQTDAVHLGGFAVSLLMAWVLRFCWGLALALLAFWVIRSDALLVLQDSLVFLLGGMVAPNLLLPGAMQTLSKALPFRYMLGFPTEALTAQVDLPGLASGLLIQALWTAVAMGLAWLAWQAGQRHYTAVGG
jgi:ABC-2 type transport system permease protein